MLVFLQFYFLVQLVQSFCCVWLFEIPWTAACQTPLYITNSQNPPKPMSIESVMPSNHLILCHSLLQWTTDCFQIGKGVCQGCILSPCLFYFYAEYFMRNAGLEETQAGIKIAGRNVNTLDMQMIPIYGRKWRGIKEPLDERERGEWINWFKAQHSEN